MEEVHELDGRLSERCGREADRCPGSRRASTTPRGCIRWVFCAGRQAFVGAWKWCGSHRGCGCRSGRRFCRCLDAWMRSFREAGLALAAMPLACIMATLIYLYLDLCLPREGGASAAPLLGMFSANAVVATIAGRAWQPWLSAQRKPPAFWGFLLILTCFLMAPLALRFFIRAAARYLRP